MSYKTKMLKRREPERLIALVPTSLKVHLPSIGVSGSDGDYSTVPPVALYMIIAGDDQTPCRWNGRQLTVEWIDDNGVPLFTKEQATDLINCTYKFFESVGRTAKPILRPVPVFKIQII